MADRFGYALPGFVNDVGYQSVGVPGVVDGLGVAHQRWGSRPWADLLAPAIRLAHDGFAVTKSTREWWEDPAEPGRVGGHERMTATPAAAKQFSPGGALLEVGERCVQADQGRTLEILAAHGHRAFYEEEIAEAIADDFAANRGHVTLDDLRSYRAQVLAPLVSGFREWRVYGTPPPCGGVMVGQMLGLLERYEAAAAPRGGAAELRLLAEAMKYAIAARVRFGADPTVLPFDAEALLAPGAVDEALARLDAGGRLEVPASPPARESADTTHVLVIDGAGAVVSLTHSLGSGSGVITPGLGFLHNNYMAVFNPEPGRIDSIAPGARRATSIAPTILTCVDGRPVLAAGAAGATRIASAVVQCIVNALDHGLTATEAVAAPRMDCQGAVLELEDRIPAWVAGELEAAGYIVHRRPRNYDPYFARVQLAVRRGGHWDAQSDPRRDGGAALSTA